MRTHMRVGCVSLCAAAAILAAHATSASAYNPIIPSKADQTVVLDGKKLTIDQVVDVARYGAKVRLERRRGQRSLNAYYLAVRGRARGHPDLLLQPRHRLGRQTPIFYGDPLSTGRSQLICPTSGLPTATSCSRGSCRPSRTAPRGGFGPEVADEEIVRAMMVVRANNMVYEAATPADDPDAPRPASTSGSARSCMSRGSPGEGDLPQMGNVEGHDGRRRRGLLQRAAHDAPGAHKAGLALQDSRRSSRVGRPFAADDAAVVSTNAFSAGQAALLLYDAQAHAQLGRPDLRDRTAGHELERHADRLDRAGATGRSPGRTSRPRGPST